MTNLEHEVREDCFNGVMGICPDCSYDPTNNQRCPTYFPVKTHLIQRISIERKPKYEDLVMGLGEEE